MSSKTYNKQIPPPNQSTFFEMNDKDENSIGGRKSKHHINGQDRLVRIFSYRYLCKKEKKVLAIDGKEYYIDVALMHNHPSVEIFSAALEVDTYQYGDQKKKSPRHILNRDVAIMKTINCPVIRIDVDALKEGRSQTKYYMNDEAIRNLVTDKILDYWNNPERYMATAQRG